MQEHAWRASDFVEFEQEKAKKRLEEKQEKLQVFKKTLKTRVVHKEAERKQILKNKVCAKLLWSFLYLTYQKEIAIEESIRRRTKYKNVKFSDRPYSASSEVPY